MCGDRAQVPDDSFPALAMAVRVNAAAGEICVYEVNGRVERDGYGPVWVLRALRIERSEEESVAAGLVDVLPAVWHLGLQPGRGYFSIVMIGDQTVGLCTVLKKHIVKRETRVGFDETT